MAFSPAEVELKPGLQAAVQVSIATGAKLHGARFELPGVQEGVVATFEASEDGASGTLTLSASEATQPDDRSLMVKGASALDGSKAWVGALRIKTTQSLVAKSIFVDPLIGNDNNVGSATSPLRTLGKAVTLAISGDTVSLAAGSFTPLGNGVHFPITVPSGVTIKGTLGANGSKRTFLSPATSAEDATGLVMAGDSTVKDLEMDVFGIAVQAQTGMRRPLPSRAFGLTRPARFAACSGNTCRDGSNAHSQGHSFPDLSTYQDRRSRFGRKS